MQRLEVSGAVLPLYGSLGVKGLIEGSGAASSCFPCPEPNSHHPARSLATMVRDTVT